MWRTSAFPRGEAGAFRSSSTTDKLPTSRQIGGSRRAAQKCTDEPSPILSATCQLLRSLHPLVRLLLRSVLSAVWTNIEGGSELWNGFVRVIWIKTLTACW